MKIVSLSLTRALLNTNKNTSNNSVIEYIVEKYKCTLFICTLFLKRLITMTHCYKT